MNKKILLAVIPVMLLLTASPVMAKPANFGGNGKAWTNDYNTASYDHYVNNNNSELRFAWFESSVCIAIPGYTEANVNAVVHPYGTGSFVDPRHTIY